MKKGYEYIFVFMVRIIKMRKEDVNKVIRNVLLNDSNFVLLGLIFFKEFFFFRKSRFEKVNFDESLIDDL